jgi:hypothetical protein
MTGAPPSLSPITQDIPRLVAVLDEYSSATDLGASGLVSMTAPLPTAEVAEFP